MSNDLIQQAALAWLRQQDLSQKTPTETFELLNKAIQEIQKAQPKATNSIGFQPWSD